MPCRRPGPDGELQTGATGYTGWVERAVCQPREDGSSARRPPGEELDIHCWGGGKKLTQGDRFVYLEWAVCGDGKTEREADPGEGLRGKCPPRPLTFASVQNNILGAGCRERDSRTDWLTSRGETLSYYSLRGVLVYRFFPCLTFWRSHTFTFHSFRPRLKQLWSKHILFKPSIIIIHDNSSVNKFNVLLEFSIAWINWLSGHDKSEEWLWSQNNRSSWHCWT